MGARSVDQLYPSKSFIPKGPLKRTVLSTSIWNTSIWRPWLFSLRSAFQGTIYPVWEAPKSTFSNFFSIKTFRQLNNRYVVKQQYNHWTDFPSITASFSLLTKIEYVVNLTKSSRSCNPLPDTRRVRLLAQPLLAYIRYTHPPKPHSHPGHGTNVTPPTRVRTNSPSGSRTQDSGAGGGRSNK